MEDRIILGNRKSRITSFNIDTDISTVDELVTTLNGGVFNDSLPNNATTGDDIGVVTVGTPLDKANLLPITISTYTHTKNGSVHSLIGEGTNLQFKATSAYEDGETFNVNGISCTAQTTSGESLDGGFFVVGAMVSCVLDGNVLNFKSGGAGLNFKVAVVAEADMLPVAASKNRMFVISDIPLPSGSKKYSISAKQPTGTLPVGFVWIESGLGTDYLFDALRGQNSLEVNPIGARQWNGTAWVDCEGYIDRTTTWEQFAATDIILYDNGLFIENWQLGSGWSDKGTHLEFYLTSAYGGAQYTPAFDIANLKSRGYIYLCAEWEATMSGSGNYIRAGFATGDINSISPDEPRINTGHGTFARRVDFIDFSTLANGTKFAKIRPAINTGSVRLYLYKFWLSKQPPV